MKNLKYLIGPVYMTLIILTAGQINDTYDTLLQVVYFAMLCFSVFGGLGAFLISNRLDKAVDVEVTELTDGLYSEVERIYATPLWIIFPLLSSLYTFGALIYVEWTFLVITFFFVTTFSHMGIYAMKKSIKETKKRLGIEDIVEGEFTEFE